MSTLLPWSFHNHAVLTDPCITSVIIFSDNLAHVSCVMTDFLGQLGTISVIQEEML